MDTKTGECQPYPYVRKPMDRVRVISHHGEESMTQQSHKDQTEINAIVARFDRTGQLPGNPENAQYVDCTQLQGDLTEKIAKAESDLATLRAFERDWEPKPEPEPEPVIQGGEPLNNEQAP